MSFAYDHPVKHEPLTHKFTGKDRDTETGNEDPAPRTESYDTRIARHDLEGSPVRQAISCRRKHSASLLTVLPYHLE
jgi:hypothetical protein